MFYDIKIERDPRKISCPLGCGKRVEWTGGKGDNSEQEYMCRSCRIFFRLFGMTQEDQQEIAQEAFEI